MLSFLVIILWITQASSYLAFRPQSLFLSLLINFGLPWVQHVNTLSNDSDGDDCGNHNNIYYDKLIQNDHKYSFILSLHRISGPGETSKESLIKHPARNFQRVHKLSKFKERLQIVYSWFVTKMTSSQTN